MKEIPVQPEAESTSAGYQRPLSEYLAILFAGSIVGYLIMTFIYPLLGAACK